MTSAQPRTRTWSELNFKGDFKQTQHTNYLQSMLLSFFPSDHNNTFKSFSGWFTQSRFFEAGGEGGWSVEEVVTMVDTECYLSPSF